MLKGFWVGIFLLLGLSVLSLSAYAYPDFSLSLSPGSLSLCPCSTIGSFTDHGSDINLVIRNEGDVADTYELSLQLPGAEWSGFIYSSERKITLGPGEEKRIEPVWITPGCSVKPGSYTVTFRAKSKTYGEERERTLSIEILKCHQVDLQLQKTAETCRGMPIELGMNITNYGKYGERFSPEASVDWAKFSSDTISVKSGETKPITMTLEPSMDMTGTKSITVTLESLDSYAEDSEEFRLRIDDCYSFQASLEPASQSVCKGRPANYVLRIGNTGSREDSYSVYAPDWVSPDSDSITLAPGEGRDLVLEAKAIGTGEFHFNITVISARHPLYPELRKVVGGIADARECRGVAVVISPPSSEICGGEGSEYQVTVKNIGTVTDTFILETPLGELEQDKIALEPGKSEVVRLTIEPGSVSPGSRKVKVKASSDGVYDEDEADLIVENCYSAGITLTPDSASVCPCSSLEFEAELENLGKLPDNYSFSFTSPDNMSGADFEETLELLPGESETFRLAIPIPCDTKAGTYKIKAEAVSENTRELQEAALVVKEMGECYSLELRTEMKSLKTVTGKAAVFLITAENTGEVADYYRLLLVGPEWSYLGTGEFSLEPGKSRMIYVYASPSYGSELKEYSLGLTAVAEHSTAELALTIEVVDKLAGEEPSEPSEPSENVTPTENLTNVTGNVSMNVSFPTGQVIGEGVALSWKIIAVSLIALAIVVILITRFVILIR